MGREQINTYLLTCDHPNCGKKVVHQSAKPSEHPEGWCSRMVPRPGINWTYSNEPKTLCPECHDLLLKRHQIYQTTEFRRVTSDLNVYATGRVYRESVEKNGRMDHAHTVYIDGWRSDTPGHKETNQALRTLRSRFSNARIIVNNAGSPDDTIYEYWRHQLHHKRVDEVRDCFGIAIEPKPRPQPPKPTLFNSVTDMEIGETLVLANYKVYKIVDGDITKYNTVISHMRSMRPKQGNTNRALAFLRQQYPGTIELHSVGVSGSISHSYAKHQLAAGRIDRALDNNLNEVPNPDPPKKKPLVAVLPPLRTATWQGSSSSTL